MNELKAPLEIIVWIYDASDNNFKTKIISQNILLVDGSVLINIIHSNI